MAASTAKTSGRTYFDLYSPVPSLTRGPVQVTFRNSPTNRQLLVIRLAVVDKMRIIRPSDIDLLDRRVYDQMRNVARGIQAKFRQLRKAGPAEADLQMDGLWFDWNDCVIKSRLCEYVRLYDAARTEVPDAAA